MLDIIAWTGCCS